MNDDVYFQRILCISITEIDAHEEKGFELLGTSRLKLPSRTAMDTSTFCKYVLVHYIVLVQALQYYKIIVVHVHMYFKMSWYIALCTCTYDYLRN